MTRVVFLRAGQTLLGYDISGHSGAGVAGEDVVCAAISSAAYLVANTITEVGPIPAETAATDGHMTVRVDKKDAAGCQSILQGLLLHMEQLEQQYPHHIQVTNLEV